MTGRLCRVPRLRRRGFFASGWCRVGAAFGVRGRVRGCAPHGVCSVVSRFVADLALAVDIGGTKLACGLVTEAGDLVQRAQVPTAAASSSGEELWSHLAALVTEMAGPGRRGATASPSAASGAADR